MDFRKIYLRAEMKKSDLEEDPVHSLIAGTLQRIEFHCKEERDK
mgnify:CR=1 FL=1